MGTSQSFWQLDGLMPWWTREDCRGLPSMTFAKVLKRYRALAGEHSSRFLAMLRCAGENRGRIMMSEGC